MRLSMSPGWGCCGFGLATALTMGFALPNAQAQQGDYRYYYFDQAVPLQLDAGRIAVYQSQSDPAALDAAFVAAGLDAAERQVHSLRGWSLVRTADVARNPGGAEELVAEVAAQPGVDFVSPVFLDELGGPLIVTRNLLVGFHENLPERLANSVLTNLDVGVVQEAGWANMPGAYRIEAHSRNGFDVLAAANALATRPEIEWAEPDMIFTGRTAPDDDPVMPNDTLFDDLWGIHNTGQRGGTADEDMDGPEAWGIDTGTSTVEVLIIDTGVDNDHPDLNTSLGQDFTDENSPQGNPFNQCDNHGTAVAGCVSAVINNGLGVAGISPDCESVSARTFVSNVPCDGNWTSQGSWTVDALTYAEDNGIEITNNSNAYGFMSGAIESKYEQTRNDGIVHFAAAGNQGIDSLAYPASLPTVVGVAALNRDGERAGFSQYGEGLAISAPGDDITTTDREGSPGYVNGDYAVVDGTSFASPYTAGVAALVRTVNPSLNAFQVENVLFATAVDLGRSGYDTDFGWGFVNARFAIEAAQADTCGDGSCYKPNGSPGCNDDDCCTAVCAKDSYCCHTNWDSICADEAFTICGNCGASGAGPCNTSNGSPGCNNAACCEAICVDDPYCCNTTWDSICADAAVKECSPCGFDGSGDCYNTSDSPGCETVSCCMTVCDADAFCCNDSWDNLCVEQATELCGNCGGANAGSCFESNGSVGCDNAECCAAICADDPFCCNNNWDGICANAATDLCGSCGGDLAGSCFIDNGTPGCQDETCCEGICADDPFCCDNTWDGICASDAKVRCASCGGDLTGSCFEANGSPYCNDAQCCEGICTDDPFCCDTEWDQVCADAAVATCSNCPEDLNGDLIVNVSDLLILLGNWGECVGCPSDLDGNDQVNVFDLLTLLSAWGECP